MADVAELVKAGFTAESAAAAVEANDLKLLEHSGKISVQLQQPGATGDVKPRPKVALAYVHADAGRITAFEDSLTALKDWDRDHGQFITQRFASRYGTDGLVAARNVVAAKLLSSDCDYLLWVDTDMGFGPDALDKLLMVAHPEERPIIGGLCFAYRQYATDGMHGYWGRPQPTLYDWMDNPDGSGFVITPMYPVNMLMRVAATGSALILIHRTVFEKIAEKVGPTWYDRTPAPNGELLGEDISFCVRAALVEVPIHVHTGVKSSHYKGFWVQEKDHWRAYNPPPATDKTAVVVPVLGRPQHAEPFMRSLLASTGLATVYAVCERSEPEVAAAWRHAGAEVLWDDDEQVDGEGARAHTFAEKANLAYRQTVEKFLFTCGSDVTFHPGWLSHAQHVADVLEASVVGVNDLGNQRTLAGEHAAHLLIRRSYVDEVGASWDGPKVVAHEGYTHNFVDDEIVHAAKQRGVWQMALGAVVEHHHPVFGKGEVDDVYRLGESSWEADRDLFRQRLEANR